MKTVLIAIPVILLAVLFYCKFEQEDVYTSFGYILKVTDQNSDRPLKDVNIYFHGELPPIRTDESGEANFEWATKGLRTNFVIRNHFKFKKNSIAMTVEKEGYESLEITTKEETVSWLFSRPQDKTFTIKLTKDNKK